MKYIIIVLGLAAAGFVVWYIRHNRNHVTQTLNGMENRLKNEIGKLKGKKT